MLRAGRQVRMQRQSNCQGFVEVFHLYKCSCMLPVTFCYMQVQNSLQQGSADQNVFRLIIVACMAGVCLRLRLEPHPALIRSASVYILPRQIT